VALTDKVGKLPGGHALLLASGFRYSADALFIGAFVMGAG
jgi:hypothetical protein